MKRVGRFVFDGQWREPLEFSGIEIKCDHSNGDVSAYYFPNVSVEDARDLIHGLQEMLRRADGLKR